MVISSDTTDDENAPSCKRQYIDAGGCCDQAKEAMRAALRDMEEDCQYKSTAKYHRGIVAGRYVVLAPKEFYKCLGKTDPKEL